MRRETSATRRAGVPAAAVLLRGVDRPDPGHAVRRGVGAGQVHRPAVVPEPDPLAADPDQHVVEVEAVLAGVAVARRAAGLLVGVPVEGVEPVQRQPGLVLGDRPQPARPGTVAGSARRARRAGCASTRGRRRRPAGRSRPRRSGPRAARRWRRATSSPRACSSAASSTAASSGIGSRNRGYGSNGAVRIATPDHRAGVARDGVPVRAPPVPAADRVSRGRRPRRSPDRALAGLALGDRGDDGVDHRLRRQVLTRHRQERRRVVEELQIHVPTLVTPPSRRHPLFLPAEVRFLRADPCAVRRSVRCGCQEPSRATTAHETPEDPGHRSQELTPRRARSDTSAGIWFAA